MKGYINTFKKIKEIKLINSNFLDLFEIERHKSLKNLYIENSIIYFMGPIRGSNLKKMSFKNSKITCITEIDCPNLKKLSFEENEIETIEKVNINSKNTLEIIFTKNKISKIVVYNLKKENLNLDDNEIKKFIEISNEKF